MLVCSKAQATCCASSLSPRPKKLRCGKRPISTKSCTVKSVGATGDCVKIARQRANSRCDSLWISLPRKLMLPLAHGKMRAIAFSVVLLPQPLGPMIAVILPSGIASDKSWMIVFLLIAISICVASKTALKGAALFCVIRFPSLTGIRRRARPKRP